MEEGRSVLGDGLPAGTRRSTKEAHCVCLRSLLLQARVWVELESGDTSIPGLLHDLLLGIFGRDGTVSICGGLNGAFLLELGCVFGRHGASNGAGSADAVRSNQAVAGGGVSIGLAAEQHRTFRQRPFLQRRKQAARGEDGEEKLVGSSVGWWRRAQDKTLTREPKWSGLGGGWWWCVLW